MTTKICALCSDQVETTPHYCPNVLPISRLSYQCRYIEQSRPIIPWSRASPNSEFFVNASFMSLSPPEHWLQCFQSASMKDASRTSLPLDKMLFQRRSKFSAPESANFTAGGVLPSHRLSSIGQARRLPIVCGQSCLHIFKSGFFVL